MEPNTQAALLAKGGPPCEPATDSQEQPQPVGNFRCLCVLSLSINRHTCLRAVHAEDGGRLREKLGSMNPAIPTEAAWAFPVIAHPFFGTCPYTHTPANSLPPPLLSPRNLFLYLVPKTSFPNIDFILTVANVPIHTVHKIHYIHCLKALAPA